MTPNRPHPSNNPQKNGLHKINYYTKMKQDRVKQFLNSNLSEKFYIILGKSTEIHNVCICFILV